MITINYFKLKCTEGEVRFRILNRIRSMGIKEPERSFMAKVLNSWHTHDLIDPDVLMASSDESFCHDIRGLIKHTDPQEGVINDNFLPHCKPETNTDNF